VIGPSRAVGDDWVPRAQSGQAREVLEEIDAAVRTGLEPRDKVTALFARAVARSALGAEPAAVSAARELCTLCRELNLVAAGVRARALLAELLRSSGQLEQAVEQLATAVAQEPGLRDLTDPDVQSALVNLAVALRMSGVFEEGRRVEARLAPVESLLDRPLRVARCSNHAFRHAVQAMGAARRPPFRADARLLRQAMEEIGRALLLGGDDVYDVVGDEARVLGALHEAVIGNPEDGMRRLNTCRGLLQREREAATAQLLWGAARVRALRRLGRLEEAAATGRDLLAAVKGSGEDGDRLVLAYEVMRAEHRDAQTPGWGAATYVELAEDRLVRDNALVAALFRARVDLLRGADERRVLARAASLDSLTGLVNRRGAAAAIADAATRRRDEHVALLMIDLDGFKNVNDVCGHLAGDAVLQRVAAALRTAARTEDMVARWGGDEFVVVAVLDPDRAVALADRLRETVRERTDVGAADAVTASVGIAVRDAPIDAESWLRRADEAMYAAKRSGGDAAVLR
jgi:diguanylate cyclase (GGDEF)-like protein